MISPFNPIVPLWDKDDGGSSGKGKNAARQSAEEAENAATGAHPPMEDLVPNQPSQETVEDALGLGDRLKQASQKKKPDNQRTLSEEEIQAAEGDDPEPESKPPKQEPPKQEEPKKPTQPEPKPAEEPEAEEDDDTERADELVRLREQLEETAKMKLQTSGVDFPFPAGPTQEDQISGKWVNGKFVADDPSKQPIIDQQMARQTQPQQPQQPSQPESLFEGAQPQQSQQQTQRLTLSDEKFQEITEDKSSFMQFMEDYGRALSERILVQVQRDTEPRILNATNQRIQAAQQVNDFYHQNPDLKPYRNVLALKAFQLQQQNPNWDLDKILKETEQSVRKDLQIGRNDNNSTNNQPQGGDGEQQSGRRRQNPKFAGGAITGRRRVPAGGRHGSPVANELAEMDIEGKHFSR